MKTFVLSARRIPKSVCSIILFIYTFSVILSPLQKKTDFPAVETGTAGTSFIFVIDAGHGGRDGGASAGEILEKDLNLSIAMTLGGLLTENGYSVVYTRTEDKLLSTDEDRKAGIAKINDLKNRVSFAMAQENPIFVSIHMNSFGDGKYSGLQVFYSENNAESRILAENIRSEVKTAVQPTNERKIKPGKDIYVLEHISCPAVLIECGFMSNTEELSKLSEKEYQKQLSFAIYCGMIEYIK